MKLLTFPFVLLLLVGIMPGVGAYEDKAAVTQALNDYASAFSTFDAQSTVRYYHEPVMFVTEKGVVVKATRTEAASRLRPLWEDLKAGGYARSEYTELHVKQLSPSIALVGIVAVRYKANGQELNRTGGTYVLRKTSEGWKIAVLVSHGTDTVPRLD